MVHIRTRQYAKNLLYCSSIFATLRLYVDQSGITDANGARLYFETAGSGEVLVFIHGRGLDARMWDPQFEVFAQRFSVIRYDMRAGLGGRQFQLLRAIHTPKISMHCFVSCGCNKLTS